MENVDAPGLDTWQEQEWWWWDGGLGLVWFGFWGRKGWGEGDFLVGEGCFKPS